MAPTNGLGLDGLLHPGLEVVVRDRGWAWDRAVPLRWVLVDGHDGDEVPLGLCAEIDGLFVDPEPLGPPERYTLLGCRPAGALVEALRQAEVWLPSVMLSPVHEPREAARRHLVPGYDRCPYDLRRWGQASTLDHLLGMLAEAEIEVELR